MKFCESKSGIFLRLDPGEPIVESIERAALDHELRVAFVCSGVGMASRLRLGFFDAERDTYDETEFDGVQDINSVAGNVTWLEGRPKAHVHLQFNDPRHVVRGGHLMEGHCHVTVELFLLRADDLRLERLRIAGLPATRICPWAERSSRTSRGTDPPPSRTQRK